MISVATLALAMTIGGAGYDDALARGQVSMSDPARREFYETVVLPKIQPELSRLVPKCAHLMKHGDPMATVVLVISYKDGVAAQIFLDQDTPVGRCLADGVAALDFPKSPFPDFAEVQGFRIRP